MKICLNCGTACQDEMNFCHKCGNPLNTATDFDATVKVTPQNSNIPVKPGPAVQNIPPVAEPENATVATRNNLAYRPAENIPAAPVYDTPVVPPAAVPSQSADYIPAAPQNPTPPQPVYNAPVTPVANTPLQTINNTPYASPTNIPEQPVNNTPCATAENDPPQPEGTPSYTPPAYIPWQMAVGQNSQGNNTDYNPDIPPLDTRGNPKNHNKKKKLIRNLIIIFILLAGIAAGAVFMSNEFSTPSPEKITQAPVKNDNNTASEQTNIGSSLFSNSELSYVMIYNPGIYDEEKDLDTSYLSTGDFNALQIDVAGSRGNDNTEINASLNTITAGTYDKNVPFDKIDLSTIKGNGLEKNYEKYALESFYYFTDLYNSKREQGLFECIYAGKYCYIWTNTDNVDLSVIEKIGNDFDNTLYSKTVSIFGKPRFTNDVGKVNFLIYDFDSPGICGLTSNRDIFSSSEVSQEMIEEYGFNTDHALIHINSVLCENDLYIKSLEATLVHELQHYICSTSTLMSPDMTFCRSWLNEAMSGYIEEVVLPGVKTADGHYNAFNESALIKSGQSLYNFTTNENDIGVYGSVYLFSEYIASIGGGASVFTNIHSYWRNSYSDTLCEAEAIYNSVPASTKERIDKLVEYPSDLYFTSNEEAWMSKLTLDFYLKYLRKDAKINNFSKVTPYTLLYNNLGGANIEGGGRIIVAVKNSEFSIPENADHGLVYVGLDKNFKQITEIICN